MQGRTVNSDSTPAEGVLLVLTGRNLQGARQRISDRRGFYQFLALPPGEYTLRLTRIGTRPVVVQNIVIDLGQSFGLAPIVLGRVAMTVAEMRIEAPEFAIDPVRTTGGGTIRASDFSALPTERDYKALISILPQVNESHRGDAPNVSGATGLENQYFIDGVNVSDPRNGARATSLPYNFVRAVEVKTGGYEAQYGRALGAVVNAVTYSGTNQREASAFAFMQPSSLSLTPRTLPGLSAGELSSYDLGVRVSGAVVRDRLWYSVAVNPRREVADKQVIGVGAATDRTTALLFANKLTWRASDQSTLEFSVFGDPTTRDAVEWPLGVFGVSAVTNADPLLIRYETGGTSMALRGTFSLSPRLLVEASLGQQWNRGSVLPRTARGGSEEIFIDRVAGTISGGMGYSIEESRGRNTASVRGTLALARHTLVAGVEYDAGEVTTRFQKPGLGVIERVDTSTHQVTQESYNGTFLNRSPAIFVQDAWRVTNRVTVNAGLRWSGQYLVGASGRVAQRITDEWQPRVGFSWVLDDNGRQRLFGSYGRFYQLLTTNIAVFFFVDYPYIVKTYSGDPRLPGAMLTDSADRSTQEETYAQQIPGLEAENLDEFTVGYEQLVGASARLTVRGVRRSLRSSFGWGINAADPAFWWFGTPGKGDADFLPSPKREYAALEVSGEATWRAVQYRASYVFAKAWGNYSGLYSSDAGYASPGQNLGLFTPNQAVNSDGYLPNDHRHVAKVSGSWRPLTRLDVGGILTLASGSPINDFAAGIVDSSEQQSFLVPRGSAGRTPALWSLDLRLAYDLTSRGRSRTRLLLDVLRLGNRQGITRVDETRHSLVDLNRVPIATNSRYRQPIGYQAPMAARVGLEVSF